MNPLAMFQALRDPDQGGLRFALAALAILLVAARMMAGQPAASLIAVVLIFGVPVMALRLYSYGPAFALVAALGAYVAFRPAPLAPLAPIPVLMARRLAYLAAPPLVLGMVLSERDRERLKVNAFHLYGPAAIMAIGALVHLFAREPSVEHEREIRQPAMIYAVCYAALIGVAGVLRLQEAPKTAARKEPAKLARGEELEEQGRHGLAARAYEREGQIERAAESAERAGEWSRAGRLHKVAGSDFKAGEMFARAQMWPDALECYERSRSYAAAARVCLQMKDVDRAVAILEKAGDRAGIVRVLEEAGRRPTSDQYMKAGMPAKAAAVHEEVGDWHRAADVYEHKLSDRARAAEMYLKAGSFVQAGRLLEALGRKQEALESYAASPDGAVEAARLCLAAGQPQQAAQLIGRLTPQALSELEDETTLAVVARVMLESGRGDDAVRILQGLKRRGDGTGAVRMLLGRSFLESGLVELAEEELRAAAELPMEPAEELRAAYLLGCVLEMRGKHEDALRVFHDVMQKDLHYMDVQERYRRIRAATSGTA